MKTVCMTNKCSGCMACIGKCNKNAISIMDDLFAYNAVIDESKCIICGACERVCPNINRIEMSKPLKWHQGWSNKDLRKKSSSGGVASAMIESFIREGGYVASCLFKEGEFIFDITNDIEEAKKFAGSKYVKSNPMDIYNKIYIKLKEEKKVLFIGLPCQVAAIKNFVKTEANLYTVDLICHGSPSPQIFNKFLEEHGCNIKKLNDVKFRSKNQYGVIVDGKKIASDRVIDDYMLTFLNCVDFTENCYSCQYASFERISDVTLGDSWGTELKDEEKNGVSLILVQNDKGNDLITKARLKLNDVDIDKAIVNNNQLKEPSFIHPKRDKFINYIRQGKSFRYATFAAVHQSVIKQRIKFLLIKVGII